MCIRDSDGFIARRGQGIAGVAAAIVEFDPLADAVRATAKDDDLFGLGGAGFAFHVAHRGVFIGGIHVGGLGLELGGAGVDALEHGGDAKVAAGAADLRLIPAGQDGKAGAPDAAEFDDLVPEEDLVGVRAAQDDRAAPGR